MTFPSGATLVVDNRKPTDDVLSLPLNKFVFDYIIIINIDVLLIWGAGLWSWMMQ